MPGLLFDRVIDKRLWAFGIAKSPLPGLLLALHGALAVYRCLTLLLIFTGREIPSGEKERGTVGESYP